MTTLNHKMASSSTGVSSKSKLASSSDDIPSKLGGKPDLAVLDDAKQEELSPDSPVSSVSASDEKEDETAAAANNDTSTMVDVWQDNFIAEVTKLESLVDSYPYIAVDTEFPGVIARPSGSFSHFLAYTYALLSENVNMLKIIQLGLTFYNEKGETPKETSTWQFNFKFSLNSDMYAPDSIQMLMQTGLDFQKFEEKGIDHKTFAEVVTMSGLVLNEDVRWICFHGAYDFAYLLKTLTDRNLPSKVEEFFWMLEKFFPRVYDLKVFLRKIHGVGGGLQRLADSLRVKRKGSRHQAGSDSLLTGDVFFAMREKYMEQIIDEKSFMNTLYGIGCQSAILNNPSGTHSGHGTSYLPYTNSVQFSASTSSLYS